ncbi:hypothetical protein ACFX13_032464 [Malus domestica]
MPSKKRPHMRKVQLVDNPMRIAPMKKIAPEMIMVVHPTANPVGSSSGHGGLNEGVDFNNSHQDIDLRVRDPMRK